MKHDTLTAVAAVLRLDPTLETPERDDLLASVREVAGGGAVWIYEAQAAKLLGMSRQTLQAWRKTQSTTTGEPFPFRLFNGPHTLRYDANEVRAYVQARIIAPPQPNEEDPNG